MYKGWVVIFLIWEHVVGILDADRLDLRTHIGNFSALWSIDAQGLICLLKVLLPAVSLLPHTEYDVGYATLSPSRSDIYFSRILPAHMSCESCIVMHKFLNIQNNETVTWLNEYP